MASESVSFRITRTAEDLAQTVTALSQRLVRLEQRLGALELQAQVAGRVDPRELDNLESVERLLNDCRSLLETSEPGVRAEGAGTAQSSGEPSEDANALSSQYHQVD
ncbi:MAG: hypothetical protein ACKOCM_05815 [Cyanobacteriota bacterium]